MNSYLTVKRTFRLIELLAEAAPLGVSEIARTLDLEKSGVSRLMKTLCDIGYAVQEEHRGRFHLGPRFLYLSDCYLHENRLVREAQPLLNELALQMRASVHLCSRVGNQFLILAKTPSPERIQVASSAGGAIAPHASALGKVLLAPLAHPERLAILKLPLKQFTDNTITDINRLQLILDEVSETGYALEVGEEHPGVGCIGAAVRDSNGDTVAAISVSGPMQNTPFQLDEPHIEKVLASCRELSRRLGYLDRSEEPLQSITTHGGRSLNAINA